MRLFKTLCIILVTGFALCGCGGGGGGDGSGFMPTGKIIAVAERSGSNVEIKVGGTEGAAPPGSTVEVTNLNTGETQTTTAESDGSFDPTFTGDTDDTFEIVISNNGTIIMNDPIGVTLISQAVKRDLAILGSFPSAIEIQGNRAYVVNGGFNNIQIFDLNEDPPQGIGTIVIPPESDPLAIAFLDNTRAYVANFIGQSVALVNVQTRQCELLIVRSDSVPSNTSACQEVTTVDAVFFEDPSDITIANGKVYVTNSNLDDFFQPQGNGFLTIIDADTNEISKIETSGVNSNGITPINGNLYVVNIGNTIFDTDTGNFTCDFNFQPSIDVINTQSNTIIDTINISLSAQNPNVCSPNRLEPTPDGKFGYMGLGLVGALLKVDLQNNTVVRGPSNPIIITDLSDLNFTADIQIRDDGLGFTTLFNTDQIAVIDTDTDEVNPFPFIAPFPAGLRADNPNSQLFDGVQNLAIRSDGNFPDIFYITGISMKLGSVDTSLILPPE
ncbi:MAG: hypothetical protein L0Y68_04375 [Candidatus Dadabacteria bacterium]|nr:hypothetical protein [Candidatus Dadabacteria bacterium]